MFKRSNFKAIYIFTIIILSNLLLISNSFPSEENEIIKLVNIKLKEIGEFQEPKNYPEGFLEIHR